MSRYLHPGHYQTGLAAYRGGQTLEHVFQIADGLEVAAEAAVASLPPGGESREAIYRERHLALPSLLTGFADGLLADLRTLAGTRRGQTA